jgi:hypothetical protein
MQRRPSLWTARAAEQPLAAHSASPWELVTMSLDLTSLPSKESLDLSLGFDVPSVFVDIVLAIWRKANEIGTEANALFEILFETPGGPESRYTSTPPELFPIASMGVDGVHYGYVIHAPERREADFPLGEICPMDSTGVFLLGKGTLEAFENLMSTRLWNAERWASYSLDKTIRGAFDAIAKQFRLNPTAAKRNRRYGPDGNGLVVSPRIPPDWLYVPTSDGVGVLAERSQFRFETTPNLATVTKNVAAMANAASRDLDDGYAASALAMLREAYWQHWTDDSAFALINGMLVTAYEVLNRHPLAKVVQDRARRHSEIQRKRHTKRPFLG